MATPSGFHGSGNNFHSVPDLSVLVPPPQPTRFLVGEGTLPQARSFGSRTTNVMSSETGMPPSSPTTIVASSSPAKAKAPYRTIVDPQSPILNLPPAVRVSIYKYLFTPAASVVIYNLLGLPEISINVGDQIQLFVVNKLICREARAVFYSQVHFYLQHPWAISFMTGRMPLGITTHVLFLTTQLDYIADTTETIKQLFSSLEVLTVRASQNWYDFWYVFLHLEHRGDIGAAVNGMLEISRDDQQKKIGLYELAQLGKNFTVVIKLLFWPNGRQFPPVDHHLSIRHGSWRLERG